MSVTEKAQHTPGPWDFDGKRITAPIPGHVYDGKWLIADLPPHRPGSADNRPFNEEREANARLIAAAPALLEALRDMVTGCEMQGIRLLGHDKARAVIAQAEGTP